MRFVDGKIDSIVSRPSLSYQQLDEDKEQRTAKQREQPGERSIELRQKVKRRPQNLTGSRRLNRAQCPASHGGMRRLTGNRFFMSHCGSPLVGLDNGFHHLIKPPSPGHLREACKLSENHFGHLTSRARKSDLHDFPRVLQVRAKPGRLRIPLSYGPTPHMGLGPLINALHPSRGWDL